MEKSQTKSIHKHITRTWFSTLKQPLSTWHHYMEIDYFLYKKRSKKEKGKKKILQRERIPHLTERAEATKTIHIIQPHLNFSVYHSTSNSYHKTEKKNNSTWEQVQNFPKKEIPKKKSRSIKKKKKQAIQSPQKKNKKGGKFRTW